VSKVSGCGSPWEIWDSVTTGTKEESPDILVGQKLESPTKEIIRPDSSSTLKGRGLQTHERVDT